jgi:flagellar basal body-associated protein FliL
MSDKKPKAEAAPDSPEAAPKKKKPIKLIGMIAGVMALEAVVMVVVTGATGPKKVEAKPVEVHNPDEDKTVEIEVVSDKFQNLQTGRVWVWDTSVFLQVKAKHQEQVGGILERRAAEIKEGVGQIVSRAQHAQLREPERQTLNRQITGYLNELLKDDAGHALFERVLIPKCNGFSTDF